MPSSVYHEALSRIIKQLRVVLCEKVSGDLVAFSDMQNLKVLSLIGCTDVTDVTSVAKELMDRGIELDLPDASIVQAVEEKGHPD